MDLLFPGSSMLWTDTLVAFHSQHSKQARTHLTSLPATLTVAQRACQLLRPTLYTSHLSAYESSVSRIHLKFRLLLIQLAWESPRICPSNNSQVILMLLVPGPPLETNHWVRGSVSVLWTSLRHSKGFVHASTCSVTSVISDSLQTRWQ